ncbi:polyphosphate kinase 2 (plasmid) [Variovorax sp. RA8]|nr:polyphosphate kinase 2 [Variovorax sp. RA8]
MPLLPARGEFALFNRSWYNRAGVERVMGSCTAEEYKEFMQRVVRADKEQARLNHMRHALRRLHYPDKNPELLAVDEAVILDWAVDAALPSLG